MPGIWGPNRWYPARSGFRLDIWPNIRYPTRYQIQYLVFGLALFTWFQCLLTKNVPQKQIVWYLQGDLLRECEWVRMGRELNLLFLFTMVISRTFLADFFLDVNLSTPREYAFLLSVEMPDFMFLYIPFQFSSLCYSKRCRHWCRQMI